MSEEKNANAFADIVVSQAAAPSDAAVQIPPRDIVEVSVKTLMEAGAHFGHQTERWNPRMLKYIYGERSGVHILNLDMTLELWTAARKFLVSMASRGGNILFVGTKNQAREIVKLEADRCGAFYVTTRWLGGTLTNLQTIRNSVERMKKLEDLIAQSLIPGSGVRLSKKERLMMSRDISKLEASLGGIRGMKKAPEAVFILDVQKEEIAINEARRLGIPVVALVDTNVNPDLVDFPIPSNDDAARTLNLFVGAISDAVSEGKRNFEARGGKRDDEGKETQTSSSNRRGGRGDGRGDRNSGGRHSGDRHAAGKATAEKAKSEKAVEVEEAPKPEAGTPAS